MRDAVGQAHLGVAGEVPDLPSAPQENLTVLGNLDHREAAGMSGCSASLNAVAPGLVALAISPA